MLSNRIQSKYCQLKFYFYKMDDEGLTHEAIYITTKKVYDLIPYEENQEMYDSVMAEYNKEENIFPEDTMQIILDKLVELFDKNPSASAIYDEFLNIVGLNDEGSLMDIFTILFLNHGEPIIDSTNDYVETADLEVEDTEMEEEEPPPAVITEGEMEHIQENITNEFSSLFKVHNEVAEILYKKYDFNIDKVKEQYLHNRDTVLQEIGLTYEQAKLPIHLKKVKDTKNNLTCEICFLEQKDGLELYHLPCGHSFCRDCWNAHMTTKITEGAFEIQCQQSDCKCQVTMRDVKKFCGDAIAKNYLHFIMKQMVQFNRSYVVCIRPDCPNILTPLSLGLCHVATCKCGFRMCWKCKQAAHAPLDCNLVKKWYDITKEDYLENKWIAENTKQCPNCHKRIEKNGGCNHMTCRKEAGGCGYEFCWICGHEWNTHVGDGYSCNKFTEFSSNDFDNKGYKFNMKRLLHYQGHYLNQKKNQEIEQKNREIMKASLIHAFENYCIPEKSLETPKALELADEIFQSIDASRSVLIWSYPHAFFMESYSNELELFEYVQKIVESAIEELTYAVENQNYLDPEKFRSLNIKLVANTDTLNKHVDKYSGFNH